MDSRNRLIALLNGYWRRFAPARLDGADNRSDTTRGVIFTLVMLGVSALCVAVDWRGGEITYVSGDVASETLKSPITTSYVSDLRTEQLRREAYEDDRHIVESLDDSIRPGVVDTLRRAESTVETLRDDDRELETRAAELRAELEGLVSLQTPRCCWMCPTRHGRALALKPSASSTKRCNSRYARTRSHDSRKTCRKWSATTWR